MNTVAILLITFLMSIAALTLFIWSLRKGLTDPNPAAANVIFYPGEIGRVEEPSATANAQRNLQRAIVATDATQPGQQLEQNHEHEHTKQIELDARITADKSSALPTFIFLSCAVVWLIVLSTAGLISSIKLHEPDWLTEYAWLTFGRVRTIHLNAMAYGWAPMAALGIGIWMLPRLLKTSLIGGRFAILGCILWNAGLIAGLGAIAVGINDGLEWLEIPWQIDILIVAGGALIGLPLIFTLQNRTVEHLYVSVWYLSAALFWFPVLLFVAKFPGVHFGIQQATMNWWFGHNVLGLFYTPMALATIYYFLPKVIGRPVQSYNLSLIGFWALAFFYGQVGGHHLIGGPVPSWLITLSIVQSMLMLVPVIAFSINQHQTMRGHWRALRFSPTLRFMVLGGMMYTLSSIQGSMQALRSVNTITHFTHFTVAHAHLGLYAFVTLVFFGAIYFVMPRVMDWEWPYPKLIALHFWLVVTGFAIYFVSLSIGGWLQGQYMLDATRPFMDSVAVTLPYLKARSVGGALMVLGHLVFAVHYVLMALKHGPRRTSAALLRFPLVTVWKTR